MFCTKQRTEDDLSWLEKLAEGSHSQLLSFPKVLSIVCASWPINIQHVHACDYLKNCVYPAEHSLGVGDYIEGFQGSHVGGLKQ